MVFAIFLLIHQTNQKKFFEKTFLITDISLEIVFEILFLILNNTNINFLD